MKRIAAFAFVILPLLLTTSCAFSPNWTGAETANGEFVWATSPGIRFYVHVVILGAVFIWLAISTVKEFVQYFKKDTGGTLGGMGCMSVIFLFIALFLWANIHRCIWHESFSIDQDRIEHISYSPVVWKTEKNTETLEWKNVTSFHYASRTTFESTTWVKVNPVTRERVGKGQRTEGLEGRAIFFYGQSGEVVFALEKQSFGKDFGAVFDWIFGNEDYVFSPEEERRLKEALNKYLSDKVKESANSETKEYLQQQ